MSYFNIVDKLLWMDFIWYCLWNFDFKHAGAYPIKITLTMIEILNADYCDIYNWIHLKNTNVDILININQSFAFKYIESIYFWYLFAASFLFILSVGVNVPLSTLKSSDNKKTFWTFCALEIAFEFALFIPYINTFLILGCFTAYPTVVTSSPLSLNPSLQFISSFPLPKGSSLKAIRHVKYFLPSPTTIILEIKGRADLMLSSMMTGGIFSPPAVIINYFARPVIKRTFYLFIFPKSPECKYPSSSNTFWVSSGFLKYPMKIFRPL